MVSNKGALAEVLQIILHKPESYGEIREGVHRWHAIYQELTGISGFDLNRFQDSLLPSGKAISAASAAACLMDFQRTAVFLRGIVKAVRHLQQRFPGERIRILYAGTGPYATLLTPLTVLFREDEVVFDMLDIHQESIDAIQALYAGLGITGYLGEMHTGDATRHHVHPETHAILSETMLRALKNETQVPIMLHLLPQLREGGLFLPEEIRVTAEMLSQRAENQALEGKSSELPGRIFVGELYRIGQRQRVAPAAVEMVIPQAEEHWRLHLMTEIDVFGGESLRAYQSSLTLPEKVKEPLTPGTTARFAYRMTGTPGFFPAVSV